MQDILLKLYAVENFGTYISIAIAVLVVLFFIILFLGKKEKEYMERVVAPEEKIANINSEVNIPPVMPVDVTAVTPAPAPAAFKEVSTQVPLEVTPVAQPVAPVVVPVAPDTNVVVEDAEISSSLASMAGADLSAKIEEPVLKEDKAELPSFGNSGADINSVISQSNEVVDPASLIKRKDSDKVIDLAAISEEDQKVVMESNLLKKTPSIDDLLNASFDKNE